MTLDPKAINALMRRFEGLSIEEGHALFDSLSPEEQAAMDERGLMDVWVAAQDGDARQRHQQERAAEGRKIREDPEAYLREKNAQLRKNLEGRMKRNHAKARKRRG